MLHRSLEILQWAGLTKDDLVEIYGYHVNLPNNFEQFDEVKNKLSHIKFSDLDRLRYCSA